MASSSASSTSPGKYRDASSSATLIETLLSQTARLQRKLETSLSTTNGLITRASALKVGWREGRDWAEEEEEGGERMGEGHARRADGPPFVFAVRERGFSREKEVVCVW